MRVLFPQGIPDGCTQWLRENVGIGNIKQDGNRSPGWRTDIPEYAWFYERVKMPTDPHVFDDDPWKYVPTITVKDPELATLFALRWI
jgi:hypothetical protein